MTSNMFYPFDESELSPEDLAVLKAFDSMEWAEPSSDVSSPEEMSLPVEPAALEYDAAFLQEMQLLFVTEVEEDLAAMRQVWYRLDQAGQLQAEQFTPFRRGGHKIRGSAGAVNCQALATIAGYIEDNAEQVLLNQLSPDIGLRVLSPALSALEETLQTLVTTGHEDDAPLARLTPPKKLDAPSLSSPMMTAEDQAALFDATMSTRPLSFLQELDTSQSLLLIEPFRVEQLLAQSQQLTELRASLEVSQAQVTQALQELHIAQARLHHLQPLLSALFTTVPRSPLLADHSSSLIARILAQAEPREERSHDHKQRSVRSGSHNVSGSAVWDELEIERYSEQDLLLRSLNEAMADVSLLSARVQVTSQQREILLQRYMAQVALVHKGVLQLHLVPFHLLLPELRNFIQRFSTQGQPLEFDVQGDTVEVDQSVVNTLARPLLQFLQACLADIAMSLVTSEIMQTPRVWFYARQVSNEVVLEIGFSFPVSGGASDCLREPLQRLNGSFSPARNSTDGVSFYLRFPRSHGGAHCLLVRVGAEYCIVPVAQVQRISDYAHETLNVVYDLGTLLGFSSSSNENTRVRPVLVLPSANSPVLLGITVDEVIDEMEFVVKPLPGYLQRPGIVCSSIDGKGNVLLYLDLPELIRHYTLYARKAQMQIREAPLPLQRPGAAKILIADDSVFIRQSIRQMLSWAQYTLLEARDGMVALEQLLEHLPDVLLLDIEMPNLNGYDLLRAIRSYPQLAYVKTIVLTSRSSEKHMGYAKELGAQLYMTKPVTSEVLLPAIKNLLASS